ncbi:baseplate multidomain protein megatron [Shimia biformata]|uniref:baseplate multidomain protein megatron n=1 Tax=Shimia biformata TaxID=1294299 RepID=UPI00194EC8FB|nr:glycoside hydrolase/phage tail family protein [Shimia biformata]
MATIVLSAVGAAIGGSIGGTVAGLSSVAIGRLAGATLGRVIDQSVMGTGSRAVETGKVDRFRITGAAEGNPVARAYGRVRLGGQVIWASQFLETSSTSGGGKGASRQPRTTTYSYSVSLAIALCEGEIAHVGRIWADGVEVAPSSFDMRVYTGSADQLPDPKIEAVEGAGMAPAYRGTAYVVFESLDLGRFGNRIPQFSFEVIRPAPAGQEGADSDPARAVKAVALIPGSGEYALATSPAYVQAGAGGTRVANVNSPSGQSDLETSINSLRGEAPNCGAASLVVSWFGNDLRCGSCDIAPKVENASGDAEDMGWQVAGLTRETAQTVAQLDGAPVYGGTPDDASVMAAIRHIRDEGLDVMFYPFILMEQLGGNGLTDPWSGAADQPVLPWRGRITLSAAPGQAGSPDGTATAEQEVADFFGTATVSDFSISGGNVGYSGPAEWRYRRFILHQAALCAAAGGVSAFCIGSEMRGLTQIRGAGGSFPAVAALRQLAADVRQILGPDCQIGYAADWSEYFGYHPQDGSGDVYFHLDPLWSDDNIDFIGIDNYMPLSDWRDGADHADAGWGSIYDLDYLKANIAGGEGFDWYYHSPEAEAAQIRSPITDGAYDEPWIYRVKDIRSWWQNSHHNRIDGVREETPTEWQPQSKPVWFTEIGCAAIDKGTNQPNRFLDAKSSENGVPRASNARRDDYIQHQYLKAMAEFWGDAANNPVSTEYDGAMVDMSRAFVWAWDSRPFPFFPNNRALWSDGANFARGHWINGRIASRSLASVVTEICHASGLTRIDVTDLRGMVRGYAVAEVADARAALQPLMLAHGFDAIERDGVLKFIMRDGTPATVLDPDLLAVVPELDGITEHTRQSEAETAGRVRVGFVEAEADFEIRAEEAVLPDEATHAVTGTEFPLAMTRAEGRQLAERWLAESRLSRDSLRLGLPPSQLGVGAGDVISLPEQGRAALYRVDRVEQGAMQVLEAVRIDPASYQGSDYEDVPGALRGFVPPVPVTPVFLDLPLMTGDEVPHAPHLAVAATPWPGSVAVYGSDSDSDYTLETLVQRQAVVGTTATPLFAARPGLFDRGEPLEIHLSNGELQSVSRAALLNGANLMAVGDGSSGNWELFQFESAELVGPGRWWLSSRLRGQLGTDALMPDVWPAGSRVVLIDAAVGQLPLATNRRGYARHYRIGPAARAFDDPSYRHRTEAFDGIGLRPLSPCHLRLTGTGGDLDLSWIRRTRIDGDGWDLSEVPLGEEFESYVIRVTRDGDLLRETTVATPTWTYPFADRLADGTDSGAFTLEVAQVSARYGPGPFAVIGVGA